MVINVKWGKQVYQKLLLIGSLDMSISYKVIGINKPIK